MSKVTHVDPIFKAAITEICEGLPAGTEDNFFKGLEVVLQNFAPRNRELLLQRDRLQRQLDSWYQSHPGVKASELGKNKEYFKFLRRIGYIVDATTAPVCTTNVDPEITSTPSPQLVCPIDNARFALNAVNARWGSLLDCVYGSNIIAASPPKGPHNDAHAQKTFAYCDDFLSETFPLNQGDFRKATGFEVHDGLLQVLLGDGQRTGLKNPALFAGYTGEPKALMSVLLKHNALHIEIILDRTSMIGKSHHAGISDIQVESACTSILDMEDSVAAVDAEDKAVCYRNFAGVMRGDLTADLGNGKKRGINKDRGPFTPPGGGSSFTLSGRGLIFIRNVGLSLYTDMVRFDGEEVPEHIIDAMVTGLCAMHDRALTSGRKNSTSGSIYIVKPKMHGPDEVGMVAEMFSAVERSLGFVQRTMKMGVMDEERRTSVNLPAVFNKSGRRIVFANTGFLDRVGDEIHSCMSLGPVCPKKAIKKMPFFQAYEDNNVMNGLRSGFPGHAQIGKGMWAEPDNMAEMLKTKAASGPKAGGNCAWVPSPSAAVLHAIHYHQVSVKEVHEALTQKIPELRDDGRPEDLVAQILCPPVMVSRDQLSPEEIQKELEENCQSILGYVVRWVDMGIGCSKVPDLSDVNLMEDRATLRINSQLLANWMKYGLINEAQLDAAMRKMAVVVDKQNAGVKGYRPMAPNVEHSLGYTAGWCLVKEGVDAKNGLTEPVLHRFRKMAKARDAAAVKTASKL